MAINDTETIRVKARVMFLSVNEGGRALLPCGIYRPNHNFGTLDNGEFYIGQMVMPTNNSLSQCQSYDADIVFIHDDSLNKLLTVGRQWFIQEGSRLVAKAELLAVLTP